MQFEEIKKLIQAQHTEAIVDEDTTSTPSVLIIHPQHLVAVCETLQSTESTYFDQLACLTAIDNGAEAGTMEVIYNLYSIPCDHSIMFRVILDRTDPVIESVSSIWKTADWHEREAFDLLGIKFKNHPDLRRILLPADWEGYPLRKDYVEQEEYHGIKVKY